MTHKPKPSRYQDVSAEAIRMLALGESGRYEFKRDAEAVTVRILATLANWVALDPERDHAHLLVGVDEVEDTATGLVYGQPVGLPKGLDRAVSRIQDLASKTRPIPVDAFIVEENVAGATPFVRVEIRPTMAPHFDDEGRRQTRQGRSTRALTDDELLQIYLDREAGSFAARFRQTSQELRSAVGLVGEQVNDVASAIEANIATPLQELTSTAQVAAEAAELASSAAYSAEASAQNAEYEVGSVQRLVESLRKVVENIDDESLQSLAHRVVQRRRTVWWAFTDDTWKHTSARADKLERRLRELLSSDVSLEAARNSWELQLWRELFQDRKSQRRGRGTQKWWEAQVQGLRECMANPTYSAPELPDLRAALRDDFDHELTDPGSLSAQFEALFRDS